MIDKETRIKIGDRLLQMNTELNVLIEGAVKRIETTDIDVQLEMERLMQKFATQVSVTRTDVARMRGFKERVV